MRKEKFVVAIEEEIVQDVERLVAKCNGLGVVLASSDGCLVRLDPKFTVLRTVRSKGSRSLYLRSGCFSGPDAGGVSSAGRESQQSPRSVTRTAAGTASARRGGAVRGTPTY